jgi:hypothetical protein
VPRSWNKYTYVLGHRSWIAAGRGIRHREGRRDARSARRNRAEREHSDGNRSSSGMPGCTSADGAPGRIKTPDTSLTPRGSARRREGALALPGAGPRARAARPAAREPVPAAGHTARHGAIAARVRSADDAAPAAVRSRARRGSRQRDRHADPLYHGVCLRMRRTRRGSGK